MAAAHGTYSHLAELVRAVKGAATSSPACEKALFNLLGEDAVYIEWLCRLMPEIVLATLEATPERLLQWDIGSLITSNVEEVRKATVAQVRASLLYEHSKAGNEVAALRLLLTALSDGVENFYRLRGERDGVAALQRLVNEMEGR